MLWQRARRTGSSGKRLSIVPVAAYVPVRRHAAVFVIVAGIDPGKTGALVILTSDSAGYVLRVPTVSTPKDVPAWSAWWRSWNAAVAFGIDAVVIEQVGARPTQGVTSMFNFGRTLGFAHAIAASADAPIHFVTPAVWKGKFGLLKADKSASREKARTLLPSLEPELRRVKDDGVAEAALLALYGRKFI